MYHRAIGVFTVLALAAGLAAAVEVPTFEQLDAELTKYKPKASLVGDTNAHLEYNGLPFYCMFDLFLTVMHNPDHPLHAETKAAWENNQPRYTDQVSMISRIMGKHVIPMLITSSDAYARQFKDGAGLMARKFVVEEYQHPGEMKVGSGDTADTVAWFCGKADANGDGKTNAQTIDAIAPGWKPKTDGGGSITDPGTGVSEEQRDAFVEKVLGVSSWRTKQPVSS